MREISVRHRIALVLGLSQIIHEKPISRPSANRKKSPVRDKFQLHRTEDVLQGLLNKNLLFPQKNFTSRWSKQAAAQHHELCQVTPFFLSALPASVNGPHPVASLFLQDETLPRSSSQPPNQKATLEVIRRKRGWQN